MAYTKPLVTTTVTVHGVDGTVTFADSITDGQTYRDGTTARKQILAGETIDAMATVSGTRTATIIPYHAIIEAVVTVAESASQTEPEDDFCKTED